MSVYSGMVASGAKDWDYLSSTGTTLSFYITIDAFGETTAQENAFAIIDTAFVTGKTITAATFYWRHAQNDAAKTIAVNIWNGSSYTNIYAGVGGSSGATKSTGTTDPTILGYINSSGGVETKLTFLTTAAPNSATRTSKINSFESSQDWAPRIVIDYNDPPTTTTSKRRIFIIS